MAKRAKKPGATDEPIALRGNFAEFALKAPKEDAGKRFKSKLCIHEIAPEELAKLCPNPPAVTKLLRQLDGVAEKIEIVCHDDPCLIRYQMKVKGAIQSEAESVMLEKLVIRPENKTDGDSAQGWEESKPKIELHYSEPASEKLLAFLYEHLGYDVLVTFTRMQGELPLKDDDETGSLEL